MSPLRHQLFFYSKTTASGAHRGERREFDYVLVVCCFFFFVPCLPTLNILLLLCKFCLRCVDYFWCPGHNQKKKKTNCRTNDDRSKKERSKRERRCTPLVETKTVHCTLPRRTTWLWFHLEQEINRNDAAVSTTETKWYFLNPLWLQIDESFFIFFFCQMSSRGGRWCEWIFECRGKSERNFARWGGGGGVGWLEIVMTCVTTFTFWSETYLECRWRWKKERPSSSNWLAISQIDLITLFFSIRYILKQTRDVAILVINLLREPSIFSIFS